MKKFLLLAAAAVATLTANAGIYISGGFQNWAHCKADYELKETTSGVYQIELESIYGEFLIVGGTLNTPNWNEKYTGVTKIKADQVYNYVKNSGTNNSIDGTISPATVVLDTNAGTLEVKGASQENEYSEVYLIGDFGSGWSETITSYPLTLKAGTENVYEGEYVLTAATTYFKMLAGTLLYGTGGGDVAVELGNPYTASQSGNAYSLPAGAYKFSYVLDKNADTGVLTVTDAQNVTIDYTEYYVNVLGTFNGWEDNGVKCDKDGVATLTDLEIGTGEFKVKVWTGEDNVWYSTGEAMPLATWTKINGNSDINMTVAGATEGQKYNVTFNAKTGEILIDFPTAVENIAADNTEAVYYNLQGVRVANPEKGLYIKVQGNKTAKVAL